MKEIFIDLHFKVYMIDRMLCNYIYAGDYQHRKRIKDEETLLFENVCPAIIDKETFKKVQKQKEKNLKNYVRKHTYGINLRKNKKQI